MNYTVAEAERILAEAKAREAAFDPLLIEAREVCARFYEADGSPIIAADHRAGKFDDDDSQQTIALAALRRGMELVQPAPAPSEKDDLRLAREVVPSVTPWADPYQIALAGIRAERKRAGGVKTQTEWIDWHGGVCPVPPGTRVAIKFRSSVVVEDEYPELFCWMPTSGRSDIIAYLILGEQP